jgi:hypothetical protein
MKHIMGLMCACSFRAAALTIVEEEVMVKPLKTLVLVLLVVLFTSDEALPSYAGFQ